MTTGSDNLHKWLVIPAAAGIQIALLDAGFHRHDGTKLLKVIYGTAH